MEEKMPKNLERAKFVKSERNARAWTQSQLAEIVNVNIRTIQRLERDGAASFETLMGVADAFEIDVRELNEFTKSKSKPNSSKKVEYLKHIPTGKAFYDVVKFADQLQFEHDESKDPRAIGAMKGLIKLMKGDVIRLIDSDPENRLDLELELTQELTNLGKTGFYLFGKKRVVPKVNGKRKSEVVMTTLYLSHAQSPKIVKDKTSKMLIPAVLSEVAY